MRIKTMAVHYSRKFNLDHYESIEVSASAWADLEPDDPDAISCFDMLYDTAKMAVKTQVAPALAARDARRRSEMQKVLRGLPKDLREVAEAALQTEFNDMPAGDNGGNGHQR